MKKRTLSFGKIQIEVPAIVASLSGDEVVSKAQMAEVEGADLIEVRLDLVPGDPLRIIEEVRDATLLPVVVTNRMRQEGGQFKGNETERINLLCEASQWADLVDVELRAKCRNLLMQRVDLPVIVSYHDFQGMPTFEDLRSLRDDIFGSGADIAKIAVTPSKLEDSLGLLRILLETKRPLCVIGMGELGRHLRAMAPTYGSVFTYGHLGTMTAPGQMSVKMLRQIFDILMGT